jgi:hypothetical protein
MAFDWKKVVATVAPGLATALGGPLAGLAVSAVSNALLGKPDATEAEISAALTAGGPDALAKVREAEIAFQTRMEELGIDLEKIHQADRASARQREIAAGDSWTPRVLATLVVVAWIAVQWFLLSNIIPTEMRDLIARVLGTLDAALMMVLAYFFGSSAGSKEKSALLARTK